MFEVFIWSFGDANSIMISSLLLILLFSDIPFIYQTTPYCITRINRRTWVLGQVVYLVLAIMIYTIFLMVVTCLLCAPISFVGNVWSETAAMLGYSGIGSKVALPASLKAMEMSSPYVCTLHVFLLMSLYSLMVGTLMMFVSLGKKKGAGFLVVFVVNLYGLLLNLQIFTNLLDLSNTSAYKANVLTGWFSPLNHATYYMHNFGYDYLPRLWMSYLIYSILILINIIGIYRRIRNFEFSFVQVLK